MIQISELSVISMSMSYNRKFKIQCLIDIYSCVTLKTSLQFYQPETAIPSSTKNPGQPSIQALIVKITGKCFLSETFYFSF